MFTIYLALLKNQHAAKILIIHHVHIFFLANRPRSFQNNVTAEIGISVFHKMVITFMNVFYKKKKPKIIQYRSYKNFDMIIRHFRKNCEILKVDLKNADLSGFTEIFLSILDKHAPKKQKTENLRKAIMKSSKLRNEYLRERANAAISLYNKQRNLCVSTLRKNKRDYFGNLNNKIVTDNNKFWKTVSTLFSEKAFHRECKTFKKVIKQLQIMKN